jgi:hypothetical protein
MNLFSNGSFFMGDFKPCYGPVNRHIMIKQDAIARLSDSEIGR